ncbi:hypothetical protein N7490_000335 [Penicillium lividum]|nr:hypothetical protein N7490_000335 [Penicillium lividum]
MGFENIRVAIVGGGLGGMSFLNAALYAGLKNVQLYEQAPQFAGVGAGVNITSNAKFVLESFEFSKPPAHLLHRAHLLDSLKERVPQSILNLGKHLVSIDRNTSEGTAPYTLHFEDGSTAEADIVIGCDGIKSNVLRDMGLGDSPNYSGQVAYRGFVDYKDLPEETAQLLRKTVNFRGPKRHVLILSIRNKETGTDRAAIIEFMSESLDSWDSESWMSRSNIDTLQEHVRDWCPQVQDIIAGLRQGTCMAIESDIALVTILRHWKNDDLEGAFRFYQDLRKPRTDRVTQTSYESERMKWIMECNVLEDLKIKGAELLVFHDTRL